jgi:hypothetical protein
LLFPKGKLKSTIASPGLQHHATRAMRVLLPLFLLLSAAMVEHTPTAQAAAHTGVQQEERLIGWLGEVPRPDFSLQHRTTRDATPDVNTYANADPGGAVTGFPQHDASALDTDFIGVGNPNVEKLSDEPKVRAVQVKCI